MIIKKVILPLFALLTLLCSCTNNKENFNAEKCIENRITEFQKYGCDEKQVDEYLSQNRTVLVFAVPCGNDMQSEVVSSECITLGFLGGITGNQIINGEDFSNAVFVKTRWKK